MIEDANAARQVITLPAQDGMTTQVAYIDYSPLARTVSELSASLRRASQRMAEQNRRLSWNLRILFADTERERRYIRRDMAREYRRPSLIHNGGKP